MTSAAVPRSARKADHIDGLGYALACRDEELYRRHKNQAQFSGERRPRRRGALAVGNRHRRAVRLTRCLVHLSSAELV
jgi:hypothetical protein